MHNARECDQLRFLLTAPRVPVGRDEFLEDGIFGPSIVSKTLHPTPGAEVETPAPGRGGLVSLSIGC